MRLLELAMPNIDVVIQYNFGISVSSIPAGLLTIMQDLLSQLILLKDTG
jgi:hypothetical protein